MKKGAFYFDQAETDHVSTLSLLQLKYLETTLNSEQRYTDGFLHYAIPERTLEAIRRIDLLRIAGHRRSQNIAGFGAAMSTHIANHIGYLSTVISEVQGKYKYPCFIYICVEKQNRRKNVGSKLLKQVLYHARRQHFDVAIAELPVANAIAATFFESSGFTVLPTPLLSDRLVFCKTLLSQDFQ